MKRFIIDTSVVVKWFSELDERDLDNAIRLRADILEGSASVMAPALLFYELVNALRYNLNFTPKDVFDAVRSVWDMGLDVKPPESHLEVAMGLAFKFDVTVYDACFLALSHQEGCVLVTADYKFLQRLKKIENVVKLSDLY